jgi:hypothetical protein
VRAEGYPFTARSKNDLVNNLAMLFERREIVVPRYELCPTLVDEAEAFEFSVSDQGNIRTGAPGGLHDDHVMSLGLCAWALESAPDFSVYFLDMQTGIMSRAP